MSNSRSQPPGRRQHFQAAMRQSRRMATTTRPRQTARAWAAHIIKALRGGHG